jgi:hypothetical protein
LPIALLVSYSELAAKTNMAQPAAGGSQLEQGKEV